MKIDIDEADFGTLCICAIRYCHGRQTYMPSLVRDIVRQHMSHLDNRDIDVMLRDCDFQDITGEYGDERVDKPGWIEWREELLEEKDRRTSEYD